MAYRDFDSAEDLLKHYAEVRKRLFPDPPKQARIAGPAKAPTAVPPKRPPVPARPSPSPGEDRKFIGGPDLRDKVREIAEAHGLSLQAILSDDRRRPVILARREAMVAVAKMRADWTITQIARVFYRDHTTVLHSFKQAGFVHGRPSSRDLGKTREVSRAEEKRLGAERMRLWREGKGPYPAYTKARLTIDQIQDIKQRYWEHVRLERGNRDEHTQMIAAEYGVWPSTIHFIWRGKTWRWVR